MVLERHAGGPEAVAVRVSEVMQPDVPESVRAWLAADAHPSVLTDSLGRLANERGAQRIPVNAYKVSHHGSRKNYEPGSIELYRLLHVPLLKQWKKARTPVPRMHRAHRHSSA